MEPRITGSLNNRAMHKPLPIAAFVLACAALMPKALAAQDIAVPQASDRIAAGSGATLRALDRMAGTSMDFSVDNGSTVQIGPLVVMLEACRYPVENPTGEAYAWLDIFDERADEIVFSGWMIASSPALNALDHARYDLWVITCKTA